MSDMSSNKSYLIQALYDWIVDNGCTPYLVVSADYDSVSVPVEFVKDGQVTLNISPTAVPDLLMDKESVTFSARFAGVPRDIFVPCGAVLAIFAKENGQGMAFELEEIKKPKAVPAKKTEKPTLKVVK